MNNLCACGKKKCKNWDFRHTDCGYWGIPNDVCHGHPVHEEEGKKCDCPFVDWCPGHCTCGKPKGHTDQCRHIECGTTHPPAEPCPAPSPTKETCERCGGSGNDPGQGDNGYSCQLFHGSPTPTSPEDWEARLTTELDERFPGWSVHFPTLYEYIRAERERVAEALMVEEKKHDEYGCEQIEVCGVCAFNDAVAEMKAKRERLG